MVRSLAVLLDGSVQRLELEMSLTGAITQTPAMDPGPERRNP